MQVEIKCPHCGHMNKAEGLELTFPEVLFCDVDTGGCDEQYIAKVTTQTNYIIHTAKLPEMEVQAA